MKKNVRCEKYDREFHEDKAIEYPGKVYVHKGKIICEDCRVDMRVMPDEADPYTTYIRTRTEPGIY